MNQNDYVIQSLTNENASLKVSLLKTKFLVQALTEKCTKLEEQSKKVLEEAKKKETNTNENSK